MLLAERFAARAAQAPDRPAVLDGGAPVSYGALRDRAELAARAVAGHERVALLPRSEADALAVALGAMAAGTSLVLLDRHLSGAQVERALGVAAPALVV
ncbi:MAG TPA: AMP-binding protein, partial [Capillimicrobium sp.]